MFIIQITLAQVTLSDPTELSQLMVDEATCFVVFGAVELTVGFTIGETQINSVGKPFE